MGTQYYLQFAQAYGQGAYSACTYNDATSCSTTSAGNSGAAPASGNLSNTGLMIALILSLACAIIFVALVVRFWRRPKKAFVAEVAPSESEEDTTEHTPQV